MRTPAMPTLDQLLVLLTVVETGSFTAAARQLGRATSAISYAIDTLEEQLGLSIFDRGSTRKPKLTQQGQAILSEAKAVARNVEALRARVSGLLEGLEPEVSIAVDTMFPQDRLIALVRDFHAAFPTVAVRLMAQPLGAVERAVRTGTVSMGVGGTLHMDSTAMQCYEIAGVSLIAVVAAAHPLAAAKLLKPDAPDNYVQIILSEQSDGNGAEYGVVGFNKWRVNDAVTKYRLIVDGLGWGGLPVPMVRADIESGRLVPLRFRGSRPCIYPMQIVHLAATPPGPAGRWLVERLIAQPGESETDFTMRPTRQADSKPDKRLSSHVKRRSRERP